MMMQSTSTKIVLNLDKNNLHNFDIPTEFWQINWETVPFLYSYFDIWTLFWQKKWETVPLPIVTYFSVLYSTPIEVSENKKFELFQTIALVKVKK